MAGSPKSEEKGYRKGYEAGKSGRPARTDDMRAGEAFWNEENRKIAAEGYDKGYSRGRQERLNESVKK